MPNGSRFVLPYAAWFDGSGLPLAGGKLSFYESGTSTPLGTYADQLLTTPNPNPVVADADGRWSNIFLAEGPYKVVLSTAADVTLWTADPVTASPGIVSSSLVKATGTPEFRALEERFRDIGDIRDWGVKFDGTDDTIAWNALIADINAGAVHALTLPEGTSIINSTLTPITPAMGLMIFGRGANKTQLHMDAGAGDVGTFFQLGTTEAAAESVTIEGLTLQNLNTAALTSAAGNVIELVHSRQARIVDVFGTRVKGLIGIGDPIAQLVANDTVVERCRIVGWGPAEGAAIDIRHGANMKFMNNGVSATGATALNFVGIRLQPSNNSNTDGGVFFNNILNFANNRANRGIILDATDGEIGNCRFIAGVTDFCEEASITLRIGAGALTNSRLNQIWFIGNRAHGVVGGVALELDNTGGSTFNTHYFGGLLSTGGGPAGPAVRVLGNNPINARFDAVTFNDLTTSIVNQRPCIDVQGSADGLAFSGCKVAGDLVTGNPSWTWGVQFTGNPSRSKITNNDFSVCLKGSVDTSGISAANIAGHVIDGNSDPFGRELPARATTADDTPVVLAELTLLERFTYQIEATVVAVSGNGANRASYRIIGTFYRPNGGGATLQGALTVVHSEESASAWDATLTTSGNNVRIVVTGAAATTTRWSGKLSFASLRETV